MAPRRWLWPCSDSQVLRLPQYQKPPLHSCLLHADAEDVLVSDSDHDLDSQQRSAKRRRIEAIAHSFLAGQPIFIASAQLKGPFPADRDLSLCHEPFSTSAVTSPLPRPAVTADTFIRRRHSRPARRTTPDPLPTPSKPPQSSPPSTKLASLRRPSCPTSRSVKQKALRFDLPSSAPSVANNSPHNAANKPPARLSLSNPALSPLDVFRSDERETTSGATSHDEQVPTDPPAYANPSVPATSSAAVIPAITSPARPTPKDQKLKSSSTKNGSVLKQRPASCLNRAEKAPPISPNPFTSNKRLHGKKYQATAALDASSPFMYRKSAPEARKAAKSVKHNDEKDIPQEPGKTKEATLSSPHEKRRMVLFESSLDVPKPQPEQALPSTVSPTKSPKRPPHGSVPIDMSFGQESLDMEFDIINPYNNALPSSTEKRKSISDVNPPGPKRRSDSVDRRLDVIVKNNFSTLDFSTKPLSPGGVESTDAETDGQTKNALADNGLYAQLEQSIHDQPEQANNNQPNEKIDIQSAETVNGHLDEILHEPSGESTEDGEVEEAPEALVDEVIDFPIDDTVADEENLEDDPVDELPYISTQAAMQDAHRALFDASSPEKQQMDAIPLPLETPAKALLNAPSSPVHTITPFHQFNADIAADTATDTQAPLPSTQALFDAYSPIKLSVKKSEKAKRASFAPSVIAEDVDDTIASTLGILEDVVATPEDQHAAEPELKNPTPADERLPSPPESSGSRSDSPDFIASQRSPARMSESKGPVLQQQSFRLSDIFESVSSQRGIAVTSLFSQKSSTPSSETKTRKKGKRKSRSSILSSQSKPAREPRAVQRKSLRLSLSQPNPDFDTDSELETKGAEAIPLSQPNVTTAGLGQLFARPDISGSSTIPDPSLAFNHLRHDSTPPIPSSAALTPSIKPKNTLSSSCQPAQRSTNDSLDLDSTSEDLQQNFLQP